MGEVPFVVMALSTTTTKQQGFEVSESTHNTCGVEVYDKTQEDIPHRLFMLLT